MFVSHYLVLVLPFPDCEDDLTQALVITDMIVAWANDVRD